MNIIGSPSDGHVAPWRRGMSVFSSKFLFAGAALFAGATVVLACAIDFPIQLLTSREETLEAPPVNSFAYEVRRLVGPISDDLKPVENRGYYRSESTKEIYFGAAAKTQEKSVEEAQGLSSD